MRRALGILAQGVEHSAQSRRIEIAIGQFGVGGERRQRRAQLVCRAGEEAPLHLVRRAQAAEKIVHCLQQRLDLRRPDCSNGAQITRGAGLELRTQGGQGRRAVDDAAPDDDDDEDAEDEIGQDHRQQHPLHEGILLLGRLRHLHDIIVPHRRRHPHVGIADA